MFYNMFYGITQLNNYMEEDIHNHTLIVMFRGTPCMSSQKSELLYGNGVLLMLNTIYRDISICKASTFKFGDKFLSLNQSYPGMQSMTTLRYRLWYPLNLRIKVISKVLS